MAQAEAASMLSPDDLRPVDRTLIEYLAEGRVTPVYCKRRLADDGQEYTRGYIHERLSRLGEHNHVRNLMNTGLYELVDDPREGET